MIYSSFISLTQMQKRELRRWIRQGNVYLQKRARILLAAEDIASNVEIANRLKVSHSTARAIRRKFSTGGLSFVERLGSGRKPVLRNSLAPIIIQKTNLIIFERGLSISGHSLARELQISRSMVYRVWKKAGIQSTRRQSWRNGKIRQDVKYQGAESSSWLFQKSNRDAHEDERLNLCLGCCGPNLFGQS